MFKYRSKDIVSENKKTCVRINLINKFKRHCFIIQKIMCFQSLVDLFAVVILLRFLKKPRETGHRILLAFHQRVIGMEKKSNEITSIADDIVWDNWRGFHSLGPANRKAAWKKKNMANSKLHGKQRT